MIHLLKIFANILTKFIKNIDNLSKFNKKCLYHLKKNIYALKIYKSLLVWQTADSFIFLTKMIYKKLQNNKNF